MDCELLIKAVYERPAIWDITNKNHHNRHLLDKLWDEIRKKIASSKDKSRKKWKYLKDRYRCELRKERFFAQSRKSDGLEFKTKFPYYQQMAFMRSQMWIGKTEEPFVDYSPSDQVDYNYDDSVLGNNLYNGYAELPEDSNDYVGNNGNNSIEYRAPVMEVDQANCTSQTDESAKVPKLTLKVHRKTNKRKIAKRFLQIEERKAEILEKLDMERNQPKDSDDLLFFKSLLGFMDTFTPAQNLRVRNKIQAVIFEEINASATYYPDVNDKFHV